MTFKQISAVIMTFFIALLLSLLPLPPQFEWFKPDWPALVLIYWVMALPHRVGIITAWFLGLIKDSISGVLLGQYAVSYAILAYLVLKASYRIRVFPLWQQAFVIFAILAFYQLVVLWIAGIVGKAPYSALYWSPSVLGMLLWPWLFMILRQIRRKYKIR